MNNQYSYYNYQHLKLLQCQWSHVLFRQLFCSTCLLRKERYQDFFPVLDLDKSPEKPDYNTEIPSSSRHPLPPICLTPYVFFRKNSRTPSISINFEKVNLPPLWEGGFELRHGNRDLNSETFLLFCSTCRNLQKGNYPQKKSIATKFKKGVYPQICIWSRF